MKKTSTIGFFCFMLLFSLPFSPVFGQDLFRAGAVVGLNLAQIDGDFQQGYDRLGLALGLKGGIRFSKNFELSTELFYNQRGATPGNNDGAFSTRDLPVSTINLHYADVLFMANFLTRLSNDGTFYRQSWQFGLSYGRLLNSTTSVTRRLQPAEAFAEKLSQNYKSDDFALVAGWSLYFTPRLGMNLRHSVSLISLYKNPNFRPTLNSKERDFFSLTSYFFTAQVFYNFISPKIKKKKVKKASVS